MRSRRSWWIIYSACAAGVFAALLWVTLVMLRLEAGAQHEAAVRLAFWRMDYWLGPQVTQESNRPYFHYLPFYAQQRAYTRILSEIEPGEVISPSPLLTFDSPIFPLHFQVNEAGEVTSPQVPASNWRDLAEGSYLPPGRIDEKAPLLERIKGMLRPAEFESCVAQAETLLASVIAQAPMDDLRATPSPQTVQSWVAGGQQGGKVQTALSKDDMQRRASGNYQQQQEGYNDAQQLFNMRPQIDAGEPESIEPGPLVAVWLPTSDAAHELIFARRVRVNGIELYQGMLCDWSKLRAALLEQIADLFPQADLEPLPAPTQEMLDSGRMLANVPALLKAEPPALAAGALVTPARTTLALVWLAMIAAVAAAGLTLRSSIAYAEKRSRFASAVTHELRTPLTTFRMYSEMLAEGMVREEGQRRVYLETLKTESARLAALVENVLAYARLEDDRAGARLERVTAGDLLARLAPNLERRAAQSKMALRVEQRAADERLATDVDAVGQILFNLIDNACKYAAESDDRTIHLTAERVNGRLDLVVRDHGPGIEARHARRIFAAFDRGGHGPGDTIPGVGLGLALCRGLARELGGALVLEQTGAGDQRAQNGGACFRLSLPITEKRA